MTPDLLTLSRQLAALPGAPRRNMAMLRCDTDRNNGYRDSRGVRWVWDPDDHDFTAIDLTDPATGGVLLPTVGPCNVSRMTSGEWVILARGHIGEEGATLAEAAARVLVALGRVGDV